MVSGRRFCCAAELGIWCNLLTPACSQVKLHALYYWMRSRRLAHSHVMMMIVISNNIVFSFMSCFQLEPQLTDLKFPGDCRWVCVNLCICLCFNIHSDWLFLAGVVCTAVLKGLLKFPCDCRWVCVNLCICLYFNIHSDWLTILGRSGLYCSTQRTDDQRTASVWSYAVSLCIFSISGVYFPVS